MKKLLFVLASIILYGHTFSQQFQPEVEITLPDTIQSAETRWVDFDNDGLLDILLLAQSTTGRFHLLFIAGDTTAIPHLSTSSIPVINVESFFLHDYNHDNQVDIVVSGKDGSLPVTLVYLNQGSFSFIEHTIGLPPFVTATVGDVDNDGRPEWLISGDDNGDGFVRLYKQLAGDVFLLVHDTIPFKASGLEIIDPDRNGFHDIFISGTGEADSLASGVMLNQRDLYFKADSVIRVAGKTSVADFNYDGALDVMVTGLASGGSPVTRVFQSGNGTFWPTGGFMALDRPAPFLADFNSDGVLDINYLGISAFGDTVNIIRYPPNDSIMLNSHRLVTQSFGDKEHDGDLDLLQLVVGVSSLKVVIYKNVPAASNKPPGRPKNGIAMPVFDRLFLFWEPSKDDHTPDASITYDLHLDGNPGFAAGSFDLLNDRRLTVSHGNNGMANFRLLENIAPGDFHFSAAAVDNSYYGSEPCVGGGGIGPCADSQFERVTACSNETVELSSPPQSYWFSFAQGFLGIRDAYPLDAASQDTVFYYNPAVTGCGGLKVWTVEVNDDTARVEISEKAVCTGDEVRLGVESGWSSIAWSSQQKGSLGSADSITFVATQPDSVFVTLSNPEGCMLQRKVAIKISKPNLTLTADSYKIIKGNDVQLGAGGADQYQWSPSAGLSNANIPNPVAAPLTSIQYKVIGYDSLGCADEATVNIIVEGAGFIPNLFTPNDDGTNDQLKIYGLTTVTDFSFSIYNREGVLVFKTTDVAEAMQRGWDGTKNGAKQPAGVYFWKVSGEVASGGRVLLNGKDSGSLVLIR